MPALALAQLLNLLNIVLKSIMSYCIKVYYMLVLKKLLDI